MRVYIERIKLVIFRLVMISFILTLMTSFIALVGVSSPNLLGSLPEVTKDDYEIQLNNVFNPGKVIGGVSYYNYNNILDRGSYTNSVISINKVLDSFREAESTYDIDKDLIEQRMAYSEDFYRSYMTAIEMKDDNYEIGNVLVSFYDIMPLVEEKSMIDSIRAELATDTYEFDPELGDMLNKLEDRNKSSIKGLVIKVVLLTLLTIFMLVYFRVYTYRINSKYFTDGLSVACIGLHVGMLLGVLVYILYGLAKVYI